MTGAPLYTTIRLARDAYACADGLRWAREWVAARDGDDDTPVPLAAILDDAPAERALEWTIWSLRAVPAEQEGERDRLARLFACDCAERAHPLFEARRPGDGRPRAAIEVARRFAIGTAGADELDAAWDAAWDAWDAAGAAGAAGDAAGAAAGVAAGAAGVAARAAAGVAAWDAAGVAAWAAAGVAARAAAGAAARAAAGAAAGAAEAAWQADRLRAYLTGAELAPVEAMGVAS